MEAALRGPEGPLEAEEFHALRNLIEKITVTPGDAVSNNAIELEGDLAGFLAPSQASSGGMVVAEEGAAAYAPRGPVLLGSKRQTVDHCVPPVATVVARSQDLSTSSISAQNSLKISARIMASMPVEPTEFGW